MGFFTKFFSKPYRDHHREIKRLSKKHAYISKSPTTFKRGFWVVLAAIVTLLLISWNWFGFICWDGYIPHWVTQPTNNTGTSFIKLSHLVITAPIFFAVWAFRDASRLHEIANQRKDTNLKEFQRLQEWATGCGEAKENPALQISALHLLRGYLKGEYGQNFCRGAFEIFSSALSTQHIKILQKVKDDAGLAIEQAINNDPLCKQLNRIVEEDWFNLLINHDFPTATISLVGVNLQGAYLQHKIYNKGLDLSGAQLQGADLIEAQLQGANLRGAQLQGANLSKAQLRGADLSWAQLQGVNLRGAQLQGADLVMARLRGADLREAQLQGANLRGSQLQGANLYEAQLQGADLLMARLQGANLYEAQLQGADLSGAQLQGANLSGAQLQGVYARESSEGLSATKRINKQKNTETQVQALMEQYKPLDAQQKEMIISQLAKINNDRTQAAIERIKNATGELDLSKAKTGSYNEQQAQEWIDEYKQNF